MEFLVGSLEIPGIARLRGAKRPVGDLEDALDRPLVAARGGRTGREHLQRLTHLVGVTDRAPRRAQDPPAPPLIGLDETDLAELQEGLPDRCLADVELTGQSRLGHPRPGSKLLVHDGAANGIENYVCQGVGSLCEAEARRNGEGRLGLPAHARAREYRRGTASSPRRAVAPITAEGYLVASRYGHGKARAQTCAPPPGIAHRRLRSGARRSRSACRGGAPL